MTATAKGQKERLWQGGPTVGRYEVGTRVKTAGADVGGRVYEARNKESGAPALVLVPGKPEDPVPEANIRVRIYAERSPAHYAVEMESSLPPTADSVEHAAEMLDVVTSALEGVAFNGSATGRRAVAEHLARPARPSQRTRAVAPPLWRRPRWAAAGVALLLLAAATLLAACWPGRLSARGLDLGGATVTRGTGGAGVEAVRQVAAEGPVPEFHLRHSDVVAKPIPKPSVKGQPPFKGQAGGKGECLAEEVRINDGCWHDMTAIRKPPCGERFWDHPDHPGRCFTPVFNAPPTPQSVQL